MYKLSLVPTVQSMLENIFFVREFVFICLFVCFLIIKIVGSCLILVSKFAVSNAFMYIYIHVCVCIHMTMSPEILLGFNLRVNLNSRSEKKKTSGALSSRVIKR